VRIRTCRARKGDCGILGSFARCRKGRLKGKNHILSSEKDVENILLRRGEGDPKENSLRRKKKGGRPKGGFEIGRKGEVEKGKRSTWAKTGGEKKKGLQVKNGAKKKELKRATRYTCGKKPVLVGKESSLLKQKREKGYRGNGSFRCRSLLTAGNNLFGKRAGVESSEGGGRGKKKKKRRKRRCGSHSCKGKGDEEKKRS